MEKTDLENLDFLTKEIDEFEKKAREVENVLPPLKEFDFSNPFYRIKDILTKKRKEYKEQKEKLEKYSKCEHEPSEWIYTGHDSHKSYYEKKCKRCGKVLEETWD